MFHVSRNIHLLSKISIAIDNSIFSKVIKNIFTKDFTNKFGAINLTCVKKYKFNLFTKPFQIMFQTFDLMGKIDVDMNGTNENVTFSNFIFWHCPHVMDFMNNIGREMWMSKIFAISYRAKSNSPHIIFLNNLGNFSKTFAISYRPKFNSPTLWQNDFSKGINSNFSSRSLKFT